MDRFHYRCIALPAFVFQLDVFGCVVGEAAFQGDGIELGSAGQLAAVLGSPPSRCSTTSVAQSRPVTREIAGM